MITKDFHQKEFRCRCYFYNCEFRDGVGINKDFVEKLQKIRTATGIPMHINSGLRCKLHNEAIFGSKRSFHLKGLASDVHCNSARKRVELVKEALALGLTVGIYKTFLHLDMRDKQILFYGEA